MIHKLKNTPIRKLIRALEQDGFRYKDAREAKGFIDILMAAVLLFIITIQRRPFLPAHSIAFLMVQNGIGMTSRDLA